MKTWRIVGRQPGQSVVTEVAEVLCEGAVALLPSDTIYGFHARMEDEDAIARLRELKGREASKPFIALGSSPNQLREAGCEIPPQLDEIWPAPLTAIVRRGSGTLAVRIPAPEWLRALTAMTGLLASTSANLSGDPPIEAPQQLAQNLLAGLGGVVDAGRITSLPSALVDFTKGEPCVLRESDPTFTQNLRKKLRISL